MSKKIKIPFIISLNKGITFNYYIKHRYETGIVLEGWEIKSIRKGNIDLSCSYAFINKFEVWLRELCITPLIFICSHKKVLYYRKRKLLLHKKEILNLNVLMKLQRYTLIPSKIYWKNGKIKIELCLCLGKKNYDKRHDMKKQSWNIEKIKTILSY